MDMFLSWGQSKMCAALVYISKKCNTQAHCEYVNSSTKIYP